MTIEATETGPSKRTRLPVATDDAHDGRWFVSRETLARYSDTARPPSGGLSRGIWLIAEALFANNSGPPSPARLAWLTDEIQDLLSNAGPRARSTFRLAMFYVMYIGPLLLFRLPSLGRMPVDQRAKALATLEHGNLLSTASVLALKAMLCIVYYEHPDAAAEMGFDGQCKGLSR